MDHKQLQMVMATLEEKAALYQTSLPKNFRPRLARYAKELLKEGYNIKDIIFAVDPLVRGNHSPFLLRSFVNKRLGLNPRQVIIDDPIQDPWADFPEDHLF